jgi:hypothetical protein
MMGATLFVPLNLVFYAVEEVVTDQIFVQNYAVMD